MNQPPSLPARVKTALRARFASGVALLFALTFQTGVAAAQSPTAPGKLIQVGAQRAIKTLAEAARMAGDGDTIEVDAGDYIGDVAVWTQADLRLTAVNGRARLVAAGAAAEAKGIWVIRGGQFEVEGFDFIGASVAHQNGAGIRFDRGRLIVRDCRFLENENGILTGGNAESTLVIENSEFGYNGYGDGQSHNLYVGAIASLRVSGSYFHHAKVGHLLKSRAAENHIFYNRLTDEPGGQASYELEFPDGGLAYVVGNTIEQSETTENAALISYGAEGARWPNNALYLVNNTLIDDFKRGGFFLSAKPGLAKITAVNNLLVGAGSLERAGPGDFRNNFSVTRDEFVLADDFDFRLRRNSKLKAKAIAAPTAPGVDLRQSFEYRHPASLRELPRGKLSPGAVQSGAAP